METPERCVKFVQILQYRHHSDINGVVLMSLLLTLNIVCLDILQHYASALQINIIRLPVTMNRKIKKAQVKLFVVLSQVTIKQRIKLV